MGDMADQCTDQGFDELHPHQLGECDTADPCIYCAKKEGENMPSMSYMDFKEETYAVTTCTACGNSYDKRSGIIDYGMSEVTKRPVLGWICLCSMPNSMIFHNDDCPCTVGGYCEAEGFFESEERLFKKE